MEVAEFLSLFKLYQHESPLFFLAVVYWDHLLGWCQAQEPELLC